MDELYSSTPVLAPGTVIAGKYVLGDVLGFGGSAVVYEALQLGLRRSVAFKVYPIREGTDPTFVDRFQREARLMARIHHENVLAAFDSGTLEDGSPFLVVQRVRGESLAQRLQGGVLPIEEVIDLALHLLRALGALHQAGIVHRDVKPENVLLDHSAPQGPTLKLVDFGVAFPEDRVDEHPLDQPGELIGTPRYMSPEQMRGDMADARSDLYSLGVTCYEALTGRTPTAANPSTRSPRPYSTNPSRPSEPCAGIARKCSNASCSMRSRASASAATRRRVKCRRSWSVGS